MPGTTASQAGDIRQDLSLAWLQRVLNAQMHPIVRTFLNLGNERIAKRYCHLHPEAVPKHVHEALQKARRACPQC